MTTPAEACFLVISDLHHRDVRGDHALSLNEIAAAMNQYDADLVLNLNDTVAKPEKLHCLPDLDPQASYLAYWHAYGRELRGRLRFPTIDVGLLRDFPLWDEIADNPPRGVQTVKGIHVLWLAPELSVTRISDEQLSWAEGEIQHHPGACWLIASHAPVRAVAQKARNGFLQDDDRLRRAVQEHAAVGVFAGGHLHLSHAAPSHDGNCITMVSGAMNVMSGNGHSYGRRIIFDPAGKVRIDVLHFDAMAIEESWEFPFSSGV